MTLKIEHVGRHFKNADAPTLEDVNLEIHEGEFICVVGVSGCGKSTLLNLIAGLDTPTSGQITLDGQPVTKPGADRTVMFQDHALYPWLNVIQNVEFGMKMNGISKEERLEKANHYLEMVGLKEYADYAIHQISGGMRQRVALARALTMDSKVLLMDEPFSALDKQTSNTLRGELQRIWQETGRTVFFITHSAEEAIFLADRVVVLGNGTVKEVLEVDVPRPRDIYDPRFVELRHTVLSLIRE